MEQSQNSYSTAILVVSDSVSAGEKEDKSGIGIENFLKSNTHFRSSSIDLKCVCDDSAHIQMILKHWADDDNIDLILTVGGTGFSSRDVTPEATKAIIDRDAPHLASRMIQGCWEKSHFSVLSRSVCGMRGKSLILNLPGSVKGSVECLEVIGFLLPHAMDQLRNDRKNVSALHDQMQK